MLTNPIDKNRFSVTKTEQKQTFQKSVKVAEKEIL
jgi:hypothetical protein